MVSGDDPSTPWTDELVHRMDDLIDEYRGVLCGSLDGLDDQEVRMRLVPSETTLLGLVKHVTFVEGVWFDQAVTGRSYREVGIPTTPARSFALATSDTIASVLEEYRDRCRRSRETMAQLAPDEVVHGRGARPVWALKLQVLRELAQHAGHAEILREQILARRAARPAQDPPRRD
jgi:hypothetical protein